MAEGRLDLLLLAAAQRDLVAARTLAASIEVDDVHVGFHIQQCVEKSLKAVLACRVVHFRRTHDLAVLMDLLIDAGETLPAGFARLDELAPYAVEARYGMLSQAGWIAITGSRSRAPYMPGQWNARAKAAVFDFRHTYDSIAGGAG